MKNYHHVLIATDLSESSASAFVRAAAVAKCHGARLTALHVIEHFPEDVPISAIGPESEDPTQFLVHRARGDLARLVKRADVDHVTQEVALSPRSAKHEILAFAEREKADLIVLTSHGGHVLNGAIGSTAAGVINSATCDVMVVRPRA